jgi:hypothetical protein
MLRTIAIFIVAVCLSCRAAASQISESELVGEWTCPSIEPETRVIYKADHSYTAWIHNSTFHSETHGAWRIEGDQIVCANEHGETRGKILKLTQDELAVTAPDGFTRSYERVR